MAQPLFEQFMLTPGFTPFEREVLAAIGGSHHFDYAQMLAEQIARTQVVGRRNTGAGLLIELRVDPAAPPLGDWNVDLGGIEVEVSCLRNGMYCRLSVVRGYATQLNCQSHDEDTSALDLTKAHLKKIWS